MYSYLWNAVMTKKFTGPTPNGILDPCMDALKNNNITGTANRTDLLKLMLNKITNTGFLSSTFLFIKMNLEVDINWPGHQAAHGGEVVAKIKKTIYVFKACIVIGKKKYI